MLTTFMGHPVEAGVSPKEVEKVMKKFQEEPKKRILVVDDESAVRNSLKFSLSFKGYNVILAKDGFEALSVYRNSPTDTDLVITDTQMPGMTGLQLVEKIRLEKPEQRFVVMSGNKKDPKWHGPFIEKPWVLAELLATISLALSFQPE